MSQHLSVRTDNRLFTMDGTHTLFASPSYDISTHDCFRMGGPGPLPQWPVRVESSHLNASELWPCLYDFASWHLHILGLTVSSIDICRRCPQDLFSTPADETVYIVLYPPEDPDKWVTFLQLMIPAMQSVGFEGRVELIDLRAIYGPRSFPATLHDRHRAEWSEIELRVTDYLAAHKIRWYAIGGLNRGYFSEVSRLTVIIKAFRAPLGLPEIDRALVEHEIRGALEEYGLDVEIRQRLLLEQSLEDFDDSTY